MNGQEQNNYLQQFTAPFEYCPYDLNSYDCDYNNPFRSYDGTCNNRIYPWYGKSESPFKRILPPIYDDGLNAPRKRSINGGILFIHRENH